jgi:hypothetical protein
VPTPTDPTDILLTLVQENKTRRWSRQAIAGVVGGGAGIMIFTILMKTLVMMQPVDDWPSVVSFAALILGATAFSTRHRDALKSARQLADPRFVGFFAEAMNTSMDKEIIEACETGLLASLPLVRNASEIPDDQLGYLYKLVSPTRSPRLIREVLEAIRRVGGSEGVTPLEIFRDQMAKSSAVDAQSLHDLTSMVLAEIKLRTAREIIEAKSLVTTLEISRSEDNHTKVRP